MPVYDYACPDNHHRTVSHSMLFGTAVVCGCGKPMHRVPQLVRVNWNGDRAGQDRAPDVQALLDADKGKMLDEFNEMHEQHQRDGVTKFKTPPK